MRGATNHLNMSFMLYAITNMQTIPRDEIYVDIENDFFLYDNKIYDKCSSRKVVNKDIEI